MRVLKHSPKTVALVGMGPSITSMLTETLTQEFAPDWADEVWAINMASNMVWHDVVFWMDDLDQQEKFKPGLFAVMRRRGRPVITTKADRTILPKSYDYPLEEISKLALPIFGHTYLNNGVAMAIAYAIWKQVKTLKLYGCDFTYPNRNYAESGRGCTEAWLALASASGMTIVLPDKTSLFDAVDRKIYGYAEQPAPYVPENSSGEGNHVDQLRDSISRTPGATAAAPGPAAAKANGAATAQETAAPRSGESLRDSGHA